MKKITFTLPTTWDDITLEKYINLRPVLQTEQKPIQRIINILCVLTGEKKEVIKDISLEQYNDLIKKMKFLETELPKTLKAKRFKVGGKWYEFQLDARKLLFGEYISAMELLQDAATNEDVIFNNLHKILTTICRPVERKYLRWHDVDINGEVIRETSENFYKNMPITIAYPIGVFFYHHLGNSTQDIKTYLIQKATQKIKQVKQEMKDLPSVGAGG